MSNGQGVPTQKPRFIGMPRTPAGWWSVRLVLAFAGLFVLWWLYVSQWRPIPRPTFFSDPVHVCLYVASTAAAISGGVFGVVAFVAKRERSFLILVSIIVGAAVLYWTIGTLAGLNR